MDAHDMLLISEVGEFAPCGGERQLQHFNCET